MKIYICNRISTRWYLKLFRIKHIFLITENNKYEFRDEGIVKSKDDYKNYEHKLIKIEKKEFESRLKFAEITFKKYNLFTKNCYHFVKFITQKKIKISWRGNFKE